MSVSEKNMGDMCVLLNICNASRFSFIDADLTIFYNIHPSLPSITKGHIFKDIHKNEDEWVYKSKASLMFMRGHKKWPTYNLITVQNDRVFNELRA